MTKPEAVKKVVERVQEINKWLLLGKRAPVYIDPEIRKQHKRDILTTLNWAKAVCDSEVTHCAKVRGLCKESVWEMMELIGSKGQVESRMMAGAFTGLARVVHSMKRPVYIKKGVANVGTGNEDREGGTEDHGVGEAGGGDEHADSGSVEGSDDAAAV
jgi:hypothetical protein